MLQSYNINSEIIQLFSKVGVFISPLLTSHTVPIHTTGGRREKKRKTKALTNIYNGEIKNSDSKGETVRIFNRKANSQKLKTRYEEALYRNHPAVI